MILDGKSQISRAALAAEALQRGLTVELPVAGVSMLPLLRRGDVVTLAPARAGELRAGDLAFVARGDGFLLHRVISTAPLVTRGDGCAAPDPPHADHAALGRAIALRRRGLRLRLDRPVGRALSALSRALGPIILSARGR